MPTTNSFACPSYRRIVRHAARATIRDWLRGLSRSGRYSFEVNGIGCLLEFYLGHWGMEEGGRWRWGRTGIDPDEDLSGEDVLLEVALGRKLSPEPPLAARLRLDFPVLCEGASLTRDEIRAQVTARARQNLGKLVLRPLPPA